MHCEVTQPELVSFYFGDVEEQARARVETHLRGCRSCLDAYLSLKRSIEAADLEPSDEARVRLRDAVARELSAAEPAAWLWWERPLAVAFATAAVALATLTVGRL
jgi:predicted anti-sigma-YlaC factor YlaD